MDFFKRRKLILDQYFLGSCSTYTKPSAKLALVFPAGAAADFLHADSSISTDRDNPRSKRRDKRIEIDMLRADIPRLIYAFSVLVAYSKWLHLKFATKRQILIGCCARVFRGLCPF